MKVLVLGGAGYIGSHCCKMLATQGNEVVVFDNLSTGHLQAVQWGQLIQGDILDPTALLAAFESHGPFDLVMHFCAKSLVGESVSDPASYYRNNVVGTLNLLDVMRQTNHHKLIFSSTAAVFGMPSDAVITEKSSRQPVNPYGQSKKIIEDILQDYANAYGFNSVSLRYFNAAGADPAGQIGERHEPETHLIPNVLKSVLDGQNQKLKVFGKDYPTPDGTCVRDYIHVNDLATAHIAAGAFLQHHAGAFTFNLGNGSGFSVLEIIDAASRVVGKNIQYAVEAPRQGDPATLVADASQAKKVLGWQPTYTEIEAIIDTAWHWHQNEIF